MNGDSSQSDSAGRAQLVLDIGRRVEHLDAGGESPLNWGNAIRSLDRTLGRIKYAAEENDLLDARRHLVTLGALVLITGRDRGLLTEHDAVAATDAANGNFPTSTP